MRSRRANYGGIAKFFGALQQTLAVTTATAVSIIGGIRSLTGSSKEYDISMSNDFTLDRLQPHARHRRFEQDDAII